MGNYLGWKAEGKAAKLLMIGTAVRSTCYLFMVYSKSSVLHVYFYNSKNNLIFRSLPHFSVTIYNLKEKIKESDLQNLRFFAEYGK